MSNVYVLRSFKNGKHYIGSTGGLTLVRLNQHNSGSNKWTNSNTPFILIRGENFHSKTEDRKREIFLESGQGRKYLDNVLKEKSKNP